MHLHIIAKPDRSFRTAASLTAILLICLMLTGCATAGADLVYGTGFLTSQPDVVIVRPLAVTFDDTRQDADVVPSWMTRNVRKAEQSSADIEFGRMAAEAVVSELIRELTIRGIPAALATDARGDSRDTVIITGQFVDPSTETKSLRPAIGYTLKQGLAARVQITQDRKCIGELSVYASETKGEAAAIDFAAQIAHHIYQSYVQRGWVAEGK